MRVKRFIVREPRFLFSGAKRGFPSADAADAAQGRLPLLSLADDAAAMTVFKVVPSGTDSSLSDIIRDNGVACTVSFGSSTDFGTGSAAVTLPYMLADGVDVADPCVVYIEDGNIARGSSAPTPMVRLLSSPALLDLCRYVR